MTTKWIEPLATLFASIERQTPRIEKCLDRLSEDDVWKRLRPKMNSVGNLCLHLAGNESHYIGHGIGETGYVRDRPHEFDATGGYSKAELVAKLHAARQSTLRSLDGLTAADLDRALDGLDYPEQPTVLNVVVHVVQHYGYHTGQIVLLTKLLQATDERVLQWGH